MNKKMMKGFTLVEIMIVVAIIAILAAVAIPNFVSYRKQSQATACVSNLKQLQAAMEQYKMGHTDTPTLAALCGTEDGKLIKATPVCPAGGTYTLADPEPTCSIGNTLGAGFEHQLTKTAQATD